MYDPHEWLTFARWWLLNRALGELAVDDAPGLAASLRDRALLTQNVPLTTPIILAADETSRLAFREMQRGVDAATLYSEELERLAQLTLARERAERESRELTRAVTLLRGRLTDSTSTSSKWASTD